MVEDREIVVDLMAYQGADLDGVVLESRWEHRWLDQRRI